jgi:hypothetical protein
LMLLRTPGLLLLGLLEIGLLRWRRRLGSVGTSPLLREIRGWGGFVSSVVLLFFSLVDYQICITYYLRS